MTTEAVKLYSSMRFEGNGVTTVVTLTFDLRKEDRLTVDFGEGILEGGYAVDFDSQPVLVIFDEPLPKDKTITIRRRTDIDRVPYVFQVTGNAQGGSPFNAFTIDTNFDLIVRASQDAMDSQVLASETLEEMAGIRDDSKRYRDEAKEFRDQAEVSKTSAGSSALFAGNSAQQAEASKNLAYDWANKDVDVPVLNGEYSAKHWAEKSKESSGGLTPEVREELDKKADKTYVDSSLVGKLNVSEIAKEWGSSEVIPISQKFLSRNSVHYELEDIYVKIPTDFESINKAIDEVQGRFSLKINKKIVIILEEGYEIMEGIHLKDGDFSHIVITTNSPNKIIKVGDGFIGVSSDDGANSNSRNTFMIGTRCNMPHIDFILDQRKICNSGFIAYDQSTLTFSRLPSEDGSIPGGDPISGSINGIQYGVRARENSSIHCKNILATNNGYVGIYGNGNARIACEFSNVSGSRMGIAGARNTVIAGDSILANNCTQYGIWSIRNSMITSEKGNVDGSNCGIYSSLGGRINFNSGSAKNCKTIDGNVLGSGSGAYFTQQGNANLQSSDFSNSEEYGIYAEKSSIINADNVITSGSKVGVVSYSGSKVNFQGGKAEDCVEIGLDILNGSQVNCVSSKVSANLGIRVRAGSDVNANNSSINGSGSHGVYIVASRGNFVSSTVKSETVEDFRVNEGSVISCNSTTTSNNSSSDYLGIDFFSTVNQHGIVFR